MMYSSLKFDRSSMFITLNDNTYEICKLECKHLNMYPLTARMFLKMIATKAFAENGLSPPSFYP